MSKTKEKFKQPSLKDQLRASRRINDNITGREREEKEEVREEETSEEEASPEDMTVAELRLALEDAEIEIPARTTKADLIALYEEHGLGE